MNEWHVPEEVVVAFATAPRTLDDGVAASVEQHLASCGTCQGRVATHASAAVDLDDLWAEVEDKIDCEDLGWATRMGDAGRLTRHSSSVRLVAATRGLRVSAVISVAWIVAAAALAARTLDASGAFLAIAPLVPLALVGVSFAPGADPAGEAGLATPLYGIGLVVRRLVAIGIVSAAVLTAGTLLITFDGLKALGWVLPSLALSTVTIAGSARWSTPKVAVAVASWWAALVVGASRLESSGALTSSFLFDAAGQTLFALAAATALAVIANRRTIVCQEVF